MELNHDAVQHLRDVFQVPATRDAGLLHKQAGSAPAGSVSFIEASSATSSQCLFTRMFFNWTTKRQPQGKLKQGLGENMA